MEDIQSRARVVRDALTLALVYVVAARVGQLFAVPPGNVTPVWIPSGIILAVVLLRGERLWPGIWLGAFAGNTWSYWNDGPLSHVVLAGSFNGFGDVLCAVVAARLIRRGAVDGDPLATTLGAVRFVVYGAVLGPAISALFGVTSLVLMGFVPPERYGTTLLTWWIGDAAGVLLVAPLLLALTFERRYATGYRRETTLFLGILALLLLLLFSEQLAHVSLFLVAPIFLWPALRLGRLATHVGLLVFAAAAVVVTLVHGGPFHHPSDHETLAALQTFLGIFTAAFLVLNAALTEQRRAVAEQERLIVELQAALSQLDTLRGILPICARCKNIRNDDGAWQTLEAFMSVHSGATFSHGLCDDCTRELYPDVGEEILAAEKAGAAE